MNKYTLFAFTLFIISCNKLPDREVIVQNNKVVNIKKPYLIIEELETNNEINITISTIENGKVLFDGTGLVSETITKIIGEKCKSNDFSNIVPSWMNKNSFTI